MARCSPAPASPSRSAARRSTIAISGNMIVPIGSACTIGLSETRPSSRAVGSPRRSAVHACAISCTVSENSRTMNAMKICAKSDVRQGITGYGRLAKNARTASAVFGADHGRQFLARRAPHAREAAERRQQRLAPARSDARHIVELRSEVAHRARRRWKVTAKRCASSRMRWISSSAGSCAASAIGSS